MSGVLDAAYWTGRDYDNKAGIEALARRIGHPNLSDELNPNRTAKLGLQTALDMMLFSRDYRILYALAEAVDHFPPVPMPAQTGGARDVPLKTVSAMAKEFADVVSVVAEILDDDEVKDSELARATREMQELQVMAQRLMQQLTAMNAQLHARAPRR